MIEFPGGESIGDGTASYGALGNETVDNGVVSNETVDNGVVSNGTVENETNGAEAASGVSARSASDRRPSRA